jgi:hypothetical protein
VLGVPRRESMSAPTERGAALGRNAVGGSHRVGRPGLVWPCPVHDVVCGGEPSMLANPPRAGHQMLGNLCWFDDSKRISVRLSRLRGEGECR